MSVYKTLHWGHHVSCVVPLFLLSLLPVCDNGRDGGSRLIIVPLCVASGAGIHQLKYCASFFVLMSWFCLGIFRS